MIKSILKNLAGPAYHYSKISEKIYLEKRIARLIFKFA